VGGRCSVGGGKVQSRWGEGAVLGGGRAVVGDGRWGKVVVGDGRWGKVVSGVWTVVGGWGSSGRWSGR
jgi:hypothetical protein